MTPPRMDQEARAKLVAALTANHVTRSGCIICTAAAQIEADGKRIADLEAMEARLNAAISRLCARKNEPHSFVMHANGSMIYELERILTGKESSDGN